MEANELQLDQARGREAREVSWIWRMQGVDVVTPDNNWLHEGEVKRPCA